MVVLLQYVPFCFWGIPFLIVGNFVSDSGCFYITLHSSLLESSTLSITDIASRVGYDDYTSFTKMFRQKVGMSPTEYRAATVKKDSPS